MKRMIIAGTALALTAAPTVAGPEKIVFPLYQNYVLYAVIDRPDIKEVRDVYANSEALKMARQALPAGSVLTLVHFKARVDDKGELVKDPNGRLVKGAFDPVWGHRRSCEPRWCEEPP